MSPGGGGDDGDGEHAGEEAETGDASGPEVTAETSLPASALQTSPGADSAATSQAKEHHPRRSGRNTPGADSAATSHAKEASAGAVGDDATSQLKKKARISSEAVASSCSSVRPIHQPTSYEYWGTRII
jgi:hypothetical protein